MRSDALQGKMQLVSVSSCRPCDGCPSSAEGGFEGRNLSAPSGHLPFPGEAFGGGGDMQILVQVTFVAHT